MLTFSSGIISFITGLLLLFLFYLVGRALSFFSGKNKDSLKEGNYFNFIFKGTLLVVSIYAIYITQGRTILLPVPILLILIERIRYKIKEDDLNSDNSLKLKEVVVFLILTFTVFFIYYLQSFVSLDSHTYRYASIDHSFYARLASGLNKYAVESPEISYPGFISSSPSPYHFIDIWLIAFTTKLSSINAHFCLVLVCYPLLASIFALGILEFLVKYFGINWKVKFFTLTVLFFSSIGFLYPQFLLKADIYDYAPIIYTKVLFPGCFILLFLYAIKRNNINELIIVSIAASVSYITVAPAFAICISAILLYKLIKREVGLFSIGFSILTAFFVLIYFYWFYKNSGSNQDPLLTKSVNEYLRRLLAIFIGGSMQFFTWSFFLLIIVLNWKKAIRSKFGSEIIILTIFCISGLLAWSLLWPTSVDATQFFSIVFLPASSILACFVIASLFFEPRPIFISRILSFMFIAFMVYKGINFNFHIETVKKEDVKAVLTFCNNYKSSFANFKGTKDFKNVFNFNTQVYPPKPWLAYYIDNYQNYTIIKPGYLTDSLSYEGKVIKSLVNKSPFYRFARKGAGNVSLSSSLQRDFLKSYDVNYLMVSPNASIGDEFKDMLNDSIRLSDDWRIYKLKK